MEQHAERLACLVRRQHDDDSSTSFVLPVGPGTWWYRVRGFDYSLPSNAQQMSWSDPVKLVVAKPTFKVVGSHAVDGLAGEGEASTVLKYNAGGVSLTLPAGWTKQTITRRAIRRRPRRRHDGHPREEGRPGRAEPRTVDAGPRRGAMNKGALGLKSQTVKEPGGTAVYLSYQWTDTKGKKHSTRQYSFDGAASYFLVLDTTTASRRPFTQIAAGFRHP